MQTEEVFVRFQLRVVLDDGQQSAQSAIQLLVGGDLVRRSAGGEQSGAGLGDVTKNGLLLLGIAFHRLDQIGDQVGAALQHDINLRPGGLHGFIFCYQRVADAYILSEGDECNQCQDNDHDHDFAHTLLLQQIS